VSGPRGPKPGRIRRTPSTSGLPAGFAEGDPTPPFTGIVEARQHFPVQPRVVWDLSCGHGAQTIVCLRARDAAGQLQTLQVFTTEPDSEREALLLAFVREFVCHGD
jgi:hypothetical protein